MHSEKSLFPYPRLSHRELRCLTLFHLTLLVVEPIYSTKQCLSVLVGICFPPVFRHYLLIQENRFFKYREHVE